MLYITNVLADHRRIQISVDQVTDLFRPEHALAVHAKELYWLEQELGKDFDGPTVVVTHHGPHPVCQHGHFPLGEISAAFHSDLSDIIKSRDIAVWTFGHSHYNVDEVVDGTRIVSNQAGYPGEAVEGFATDFLFEV